MHDEHKNDLMIMGYVIFIIILIKIFIESLFNK
jgi:hypothetical protein